MSEPESPSPFLSFWMAGFEGADHVNGQDQPLDMVHTSGHLAQLEADHGRVAAFGLHSIRESIGWRICEPRSGDAFDFTRLLRVARSARGHGLQVQWTLMHYGLPEGLDADDAGFENAFVRYCAAVARVLRPLCEAPPVYTPINEIGFLAWAWSETELMRRRRPGRGPGDGGSAASGYALKRRLVRAALAGMRAIREEDPRARFLHVEPLVHVVAPLEAPELAPLAAQVAGYQWQAWDLLCGRLEPELGGRPEALDMLGVNHYHSGQWEVGTEHRLHWHLHDPRRARFADLLGAAWQRYRRPLVVAETSHVGSGRAAWLDDIAAEVRHALAAGVPVRGLCLYPIVDRPDWNDAQHWHHSGLWDVAAGDATLTRRLHLGYAKALRRWQRRLPQN